MNPQEAAEASAARQVAIAYLQQRGYRTAAQRLAENDNARDVKMNEMVGREGLRKAPRCGMQAFSQHAPGYEESFALLCQWLATSPAARQRELAQLRFPMFVHCFLGLVGRGETAAAHRLLQAQAGEAHSEQQRAQCEQLRALQHAGQVGESAVAQQYLGQRITLLCSAESFEAVVGFLVQRHLMLLLRLFYKFFNVHSFKADLPAAASASAADASSPAGAAAAAASPAGDAAAAAAASSAAAADAMAGATAAGPAAAPPPTAPLALGTAAASASADGAAAPSPPGAATAATPPKASEPPKAAAAEQQLELWGELLPSPPPAGAPAAAPAAAAAALTAAAATLAGTPPQPAGSPAAPKAQANGGGSGSGSGSSGQRQRPPTSVCCLAIAGGGGGGARATGTPELCCIEVSPTVDSAVCGRADGALSFHRFSREAILHARFGAPTPAQPPLRSRVVPGHSGPVYGVAMSRDRQYVLSGSQDGEVRLWSARHATTVVRYASHGFPVWGVAFASHSAHFATACYDGATRIFATERTTPLRVLAGHLADVSAATFHPNGNYVLSASHDCTLRLWDVGTGACVRLMRGHAAPVRAVAVSPDGQSAASAGEDHTVLLWHLASARVVHTLRRHSGPVTHVAFSNSGRLISSAAGNEVCIWDTRNVASAGAARRPAVATPARARAVSHDPTHLAGGGPAPELAFEAPIPIATTAFYPQQPVLFACGEDVGGASVAWKPGRTVGAGAQ